LLLLAEATLGTGKECTEYRSRNEVTKIILKYLFSRKDAFGKNVEVLPATGN